MESAPPLVWEPAATTGREATDSPDPNGERQQGGKTIVWRHGITDHRFGGFGKQKPENQRPGDRAARPDHLPPILQCHPRPMVVAEKNGDFCAKNRTEQRNTLEKIILFPLRLVPEMGCYGE